MVSRKCCVCPLEGKGVLQRMGIVISSTSLRYTARVSPFLPVIPKIEESNRSCTG